MTSEYIEHLFSTSIFIYFLLNFYLEVNQRSKSTSKATLGLCDTRINHVNNTSYYILVVYSSFKL